MGWRAVAAAAFAAALLFSAASDAADDAKPFPVDRSQTLKSGVSYFVEGRVRIPKGIDILVQRDTKITGHGDAAGTIEVEGQLAMVGVTDVPVSVRDVTIELEAKFAEVRISMVQFGGKSAGIVSAKDTAVDGRVFIENTTFTDKATVDVTLASNEIDLQRVSAPNRVHVKGVVVGVNKVKVNLYNNNATGNTSVFGKLAGGVLIENVAAVEARANVFEGEKAAFLDCGAVDFDANSVRCKTLEFTQTAAGRFGKTSLTKCDFACEKIIVSAPCASDGRTETIPVVHCWFGGETNEKTVQEKFITDRSDDPKCGVAVSLQKLVDKEQKFAK